MSDWSNLEAEYEHFSTWKVENHKITQLHPHLTLCMSLNRQQLNVTFFYASMFEPTSRSKRESECVTNLHDKTRIFT